MIERRLESSAADRRRPCAFHSSLGRQAKSRPVCNDLSSSDSSTPSTVSLRKRSRPNRPSSSPKQSDDEPSRARSAFISTASVSSRLSSPIPPSVYLIELTNRKKSTNAFGLAKTITYVWKSSHSQSQLDEFYPRYSVEQVPPMVNDERSTRSVSSRNIVLQRGMTDYWQNLDSMPSSVLTSSCENSTGSASGLLGSSGKPRHRKNRMSSRGRVISISTSQRRQPSLLNQIKNTQWTVQESGDQRRYSKIRWNSSEQVNQPRQHRSNEPMNSTSTDTGSASEPKNHQSAPAHVRRSRTSLVASEQSSSAVLRSIPITSGSTDEDVDELNSHYSEEIDRSTATNPTARDKFHVHESSFDHLAYDDAKLASKILSMESSQMTVDSGVDIASEERIFPAKAPFAVNEHAWREFSDPEHPELASDSSFIETESKTTNVPLEHDLTESITEAEPEIYYSAQGDVNHLYNGFELETISDDETEDLLADNSHELILTAAAPPPPPPIPSRFEFKLPTFGEWIDRAFTTFLADSQQHPSISTPSSRSSSIVSMHSSPSTMHTSSSSQMVTVIDTSNLTTELSTQLCGDDDEPSLYGKQKSVNRDQSKIASRCEPMPRLPHCLTRRLFARSNNALIRLFLSSLDMSSSSVNTEKVDYDTYIINSNYEKINPSTAHERTRIPFISQPSQALLSSITSPSMVNADQGKLLSLLLIKFGPRERESERGVCAYVQVCHCS